MPRGRERDLPFDIILRVIPASDWRQIDRGLQQRVHALNSSSPTSTATAAS